MDCISNRKVKGMIGRKEIPNKKQIGKSDLFTLEIGNILLLFNPGFLLLEHLLQTCFYIPHAVSVNAGGIARKTIYIYIPIESLMKYIISLGK